MDKKFRRVRDDYDRVKRRLDALEGTEEMVYQTVLTTDKRIGVSYNIVIQLNC